VVELSLVVIKYIFYICDISEGLFCRLRRPVGRMTVVEQQLEGEFRYVNSRLITHRYMHCTLVYLLTYLLDVFSLRISLCLSLSVL